MQRFIHGERPSGPKIKVPTAPNRHAHQKSAQRQAHKKPIIFHFEWGVSGGEITIARMCARREASVKGAQNKPLNPLFELTSSLEEEPDASCLFGRGPDVPFELNSPHWLVSTVKSLRNSERSGGGSTAILRVEDRQTRNLNKLPNEKTETEGLKRKPKI
jgi:hypothetical protein